MSSVFFCDEPLHHGDNGRKSGVKVAKFSDGWPVPKLGSFLVDDGQSTYLRKLEKKTRMCMMCQLKNNVHVLVSIVISS